MNEPYRMPSHRKAGIIFFGCLIVASYMIGSIVNWTESAKLQVVMVDVIPVTYILCALFVRGNWFEPDESPKKD